MSKKDNHFFKLINESKRGFLTLVIKTHLKKKKSETTLARLKFLEISKFPEILIPVKTNTSLSDLVEAKAIQEVSLLHSESMTED